MSKKRGEILWAAKLVGRLWADLPDDTQFDIGDVSPDLADRLQDLAALTSQPTYDEKRFHA